MLRKISSTAFAILLLSLFGGALSTPGATDTVQLADGSTDYDLAEPKIFWYVRPSCTPTIAGATVASAYAERIRRVASYGGIARTLYDDEVGSVCSQQNLDVLSNIVADAEYVYWMSASLGGVARLPVTANVGDPPELLSDAVSGPAELTHSEAHIFVLSQNHGVWRINKDDGVEQQRLLGAGTPVRNFQYDGKFLYWITSSGDLRRLSADGPLWLAVIAGNASGYHAEGHGTTICGINPIKFCDTEYVFIAQGNKIIRFDNLNSSATATIYTSPASGAVVHELTSFPSFLLPSNLYFFESRRINCGELFCNYEDLLFRTGRSGGTGTLVYGTVSDLPTMYVASQLAQNSDALFWQEKGKVLRLPKDAEPLPNLRVTRMSVTQGIQDDQNSIELIQNRRTFVRVHVQSDGAPVAGVTAHLYSIGFMGGVIDGPLVPVNPVGQHITVQSSPNPENLNDSFLFELPWNWTTSSILILRAELNPHRVPSEPTYADNSDVAGPFFPRPSPRLEVQFVSFGYVLNNQIWYPRLIDDVFQTYSWIRRAYPVSSAPGNATDPTPGFRPNLWIIADDGLGSRVNFSHPDCQHLLTPDGDFRNLCASEYTNTLMNAMRSEWEVPAGVFMYGMITDAAGIFPRGQACCGEKVSSGPVGIPGVGHWDTDTTYGDWYAAHEIGHTQGRGHPAENADNLATKNVSEGCGHSPDDPGYPYADARISPPDGRLEGFDAGDPVFGLPFRIYPGRDWFDVMSYCDNQWISDYTYEALYDFMLGSAAGAASARAFGPASLGGDFLSVYGVIDFEADSATIHRLRRLDSVGSIPPRRNGGYSIRLLDPARRIVADYGFTPQKIIDSDRQVVSFGQIVDFVAGTTVVQIFDHAGGVVLAEKEISANPPSVRNARLESGPRPTIGKITLAWDASDPDGDPLTFDIFYSRDGGGSFLPLKLNVKSKPLSLETAELGGSSSALLRVVGSDGVHSAYADTPLFTVQAKGPEARILAPASGVQVRYGQVVNFIGEAFDLQDGSVPAAGLAWSHGSGVRLGTGPLLTITDLPVGENRITLTATNSFGLTGSDQVTVVVSDDLNLPGPFLSVGPPVVNWHVPVGTTLEQSAELHISNAGAASLQWEISGGAPWLMLSESAGTAPATVVLYADPSGADAGEVLETRLTVSSPNPAVQPVQIPVMLAVGDVWRNTGELGADLGDLAREFGRTDCMGDCKADMDGEGDVDGTDILRFWERFSER